MRSQCGLCVLGESALYAADLAVGLSGEELAFLVPSLPEPRDCKGQERQSAAPPLDGVEDLLHKRLVLEAVAQPAGRFDQRPPQVLTCQHAQWSQLAEDWSQSRMVVTPHQKIVAQRQKHVDVRLA